MRNAYHRASLSALSAAGGRFVVIGEQAEARFSNQEAVALTIWASPNDAFSTALREVFEVWREPPVQGAGRRPDIMVYYADGHRLRKHGVPGPLEEPPPEDSIEVVTYTEPPVEFNEVYDRADVVDMDGVGIRFLSDDDLDRVWPVLDAA